MTEKSPRRSKLLGVDEAAALVDDGVTIGVGGVMEEMVPVAFLLALARCGTRNLHAVTVAAGLSMDLLAAAGAVSDVSCAIVSFEDQGIARGFRRSVEAGRITFHEYTELIMITRLQAAAAGLPYLPTRGGLGTDIPSGLPGSVAVVACPFSGQPLVACAALSPDVAVIHVNRADVDGNAQLLAKHVWHDSVIARSARVVIVTAEEIVSDEEIRRRPGLTLLPSFAVDAVVHAPGGAWPTACAGGYDADRGAVGDWVAAAADEAGQAELVRTWSRQTASEGHGSRQR